MKRYARSAVAALAGAVLLVCDGAGPSFPPETCAAPILERTVYVGNVEPVAVCFVDPDGEQVTLLATSSDDGVVAVRTQRDAVVLEGRSVGSATVNVTARDPNGDMGSQSFLVTVPNRKPRVRRIPALILSDAKRDAELILAEYFSDPDGQPLEFSVSTIGPPIVSTTVTGGILALRLEATGSTVVRVVGTDPHGLSAEEDLDVSGQLFETLLRDDFDSAYDSWDVGESTVVSLVDGRLGITGGDGQNLPVVTRRVTEAVGWEFTANVEAGSFDFWPTLFVEMEDDLLVGVIIGGNLKRLTSDPLVPETNLVVVIGTAAGVSTGPGLYALADEIKGPGEAMDVALSWRKMSALEVTVDGIVILELDLPIELSRSALRVGLAGWQASDIEILTSDDIAYFDWAQLDGIRVLTSDVAGPVRSFDALAPIPWGSNSIVWRVER